MRLPLPILIPAIAILSGCQNAREATAHSLAVEIENATGSTISKAEIGNTIAVFSDGHELTPIDFHYDLNKATFINTQKNVNPGEKYTYYLSAKWLSNRTIGSHYDTINDEDLRQEDISKLLSSPTLIVMIDSPSAFGIACYSNGDKPNLKLVLKKRSESHEFIREQHKVRRKEWESQTGA